MALQLVAPKGGQVNLRLQQTKPIFGKTSVDQDKVASVLNGGKKELVVPLLQHLTAAGRSTIETLQVTECIGRLLRNRDPAVAAAAAEALAASGAGGQRHEEALLGLLLRPEDSVTTAGLRALAQLGPLIQPARKAVVIRQVATCLSRSVPVRSAALRTLAALKATRQALAISDVVQTEKVPEVQGIAVEALAQLASLTAEAESCFPEDAREKKLAEMLGDDRLRYSALMALASLGDKAPASLLQKAIEALSDPDLATRGAAVEAVGAMGEHAAASNDAIVKLMELLKSPEAARRAASASALAAMGAQALPSADLVVTLTQDPEEVAAPPLATSGGRPPPGLLMPRCAAIAALGAMGAESHTKAVAQGLLDKKWQVRQAAAEALGKLGEASRSHASSLLGCLTDTAYPVRAAACAALGTCRTPEALPGLAQAFEDESAVVRRNALEAASALVVSEESYCHEVFKAVTDMNGQVRAAAVKCLARHPRLGPNYAGVVAMKLLDHDADVRAAATAGLGDLGDAGLGFEKEVQAMMNDPSEAVRQAAASSLANLGLRSPLAPIKPLAARGAGAIKAAMAPLPDNKDPVEGLGEYYKSIMLKKSELVKSGKWIDDDIF
ncbi:NEIL3 [Symbiodinium natans]|uniref:NEIL3 protein n=1 Tax=Symbiodinium natans TaxID=878477 RepID=A0A812UR45_9DINO|nr:NEIL3 [Symbiodinium natans]